ncbi:MAG: substrate-binding domain-containing protein [Magnetovibrionaceae bacterium]
MLRNLLVICLCLIGLVGLGACNPDQGTPTASWHLPNSDDLKDAAVIGGTDQPALKVGLVIKTLENPFFQSLETGARKAEQDLGVQLVVRASTTETAVDQQKTIVRELVEEESVDAIVIAPSDSVELVASVKWALAAGVTVVNVDNRLDPGEVNRQRLPQVPFVSVDNRLGAYLAAQYLAEQAPEGSKAVILEGIRSARNAQARLAGARAAFAESDRVTLVASETANWGFDAAVDVARDLLARHGDLGVIFASNDMMALGVLHHLKTLGRTDILVGGFDALAEAREAIREGNLRVTVDQQAERQGYLGVARAVEVLRGRTVPAETFIDVAIVTGSSF